MSETAKQDAIELLIPYKKELLNEIIANINYAIDKDQDKYYNDEDIWEVNENNQWETSDYDVTTRLENPLNTLMDDLIQGIADAMYDAIAKTDKDSEQQKMMYEYVYDEGLSNDEQTQVVGKVLWNKDNCTYQDIIDECGNAIKYKSADDAASEKDPYVKEPSDLEMFGRGEI